MITFTRASTATYVDVGGVLRVAQENEPRFEKGGILMEGNGSNLIHHSFKVPQAINGAVESDKVITGFFGDTINTVTGGSPNFGWVGIPTRANKSYTLSLFIHWNGLGTGTCRINLFLNDSLRREFSVNLPTKTLEMVTGSSNNLKMIELADGWFRVSMSFTEDGTDRSYQDVYVYDLDGNISLTYGQFENNPFATSYIPTDGSAVTRVEDHLELSPNLFPALERPISIMIEGFTLGRPDRNTYPVMYGFMSEDFDHTGANERSTFLFYGQSAASDYILGAWVNKDINTLRITDVDSTVDRRIVVTVADGVASIHTSDGLTQTGEYTNEKRPMAACIIGGTNVVGNSMFGHLRNFRTWNYKLSDAEIQAILEAK